MIFGGRWSPPEAASTMLITLGFDATRGRIVGAVAASMMMSQSVGHLDAAARGGRSVADAAMKTLITA